MKVLVGVFLTGLVFLSACFSPIGNAPEESVSYLSESAYFEITLEGFYAGSQISFSRKGCLILSPSVRVPGAPNLQNKFNPVDLALISGRPNVEPEPGEFAFFSNTGLCGQIRDSCNREALEAGLDLAFVRIDEEIQRMTLEMDQAVFGNPGVARILDRSQLLAFSATTDRDGNTTFDIIRGKLELDWTENLQSVSGTLSFTGKSLLRTGLETYVARFSGKRVESLVCE